jgi:hypothetical protein
VARLLRGSASAVRLQSRSCQALVARSPLAAAMGRKLTLALQHFSLSYSLPLMPNPGRKRSGAEGHKVEEVEGPPFRPPGVLPSPAPAEWQSGCAAGLLRYAWLTKGRGITTHG